MKRATAHKENLRTLTVSLPLPATVKVTEQEAKELLVLKLVDEGILSQSQASNLLGISRYDLIELMGKHNLPIMRYGLKDWEKETQVLKDLQAQRERAQSV